MSHQGSPTEALPGVDDPDLADARFVLEGSDCLQASLLLHGNRTSVQAEVGNGTDLPTSRLGQAPVVLTLARCRTLEVGNRTYSSLRFGEVSVPIVENGTKRPGHHRLIQMITGNETLADQLDGTGLPADHAPLMTLGHRLSYKSQSRVVSTAPYGPVQFELSAAALAPGGSLPRDARDALAWEHLAPDGDRPVRLRSGYDLQETTMVVGKAEIPSTGLLEQVVSEETVRVYGYKLRTDVRIGVVPVAG